MEPPATSSSYSAVAWSSPPEQWLACRLAFGKLCADRKRAHFSVEPFLESLPTTREDANETPLENSVERLHKKRSHVGKNVGRFFPTRSAVLLSTGGMSVFLGGLKEQELRTAAQGVGINHLKRRRTAATDEDLTANEDLHRRLLLPWFVVGEDTLHMYRLFARWRKFAELSAPVTPQKLRDCLGVYESVVAAMVASGAALRSALATPAQRELLTGEKQAFLKKHKVCVRSMWIDGGFDVAAWRCQYKPTSFSLQINGTLDILGVHKRAVDEDKPKPRPLFMLLPQTELLRVGLPIRALFPDQGGFVGPYGENFADMEKEVVLPPFSCFEPFGGVNGGRPVSRASLLSAKTVAAAACAWGLDSAVVKNQFQHLVDEFQEQAEMFNDRVLDDDDIEAATWMLWKSVEGSWDF